MENIKKNNLITAIFSGLFAVLALSPLVTFAQVDENGFGYADAPAYNYADNSVSAPTYNYVDNSASAPAYNYFDSSVLAPAYNYADNSASAPAYNYADNSAVAPAYNYADNSAVAPAYNYADNSVSAPAYNYADNSVIAPAYNYVNNSAPSFVPTQQESVFYGTANEGEIYYPSTNPYIGYYASVNPGVNYSFATNPAVNYVVANNPGINYITPVNPGVNYVAAYTNTPNYYTNPYPQTYYPNNQVLAYNNTPNLSSVYLSDVPVTGIGDIVKVTLFISFLALWSGLLAYVIIRKKIKQQNTALSVVENKSVSPVISEIQNDQKDLEKIGELGRENKIIFSHDAILKIVKLERLGKIDSAKLIKNFVKGDWVCVGETQIANV